MKVTAYASLAPLFAMSVRAIPQIVSTPPFDPTDVSSSIPLPTLLPSSSSIVVTPTPLPSFLTTQIIGSSVITCVVIPTASAPPNSASGSFTFIPSSSIATPGFPASSGSDLPPVPPLSTTAVFDRRQVLTSSLVIPSPTSGTVSINPSSIFPVCMPTVSGSGFPISGSGSPTGRPVPSDSDTPDGAAVGIGMEMGWVNAGVVGVLGLIGGMGLVL